MQRIRRRDRPFSRAVSHGHSLDYSLDAKYMFIGVDFGCCTMLHHVQVLLLENYLRKTDNNVPWPAFDFGRMGKKLEDLGLVKIGKIGGAVTRLISSRSLVDTAIRVLREEGYDRYR